MDIERFIYKEFECTVLVNDFGVWCGYVTVPQTHKSFREDKESDEPAYYLYKDIECHGGLTFGRYGRRMDNDERVLVLGFDCGHADDIVPNCKLDGRVAVLLTEILEDECNDPTFKDKQFAKRECEKIVDQLCKGLNE